MQEPELPDGVGLQPRLIGLIIRCDHAVGGIILFVASTGVINIVNYQRLFSSC